MAAPDPTPPPLLRQQTLFEPCLMTSKAAVPSFSCGVGCWCKCWRGCGGGGHWRRRSAGSSSSDHDRAPLRLAPPLTLASEATATVRSAARTAGGGGKSMPGRLHGHPAGRRPPRLCGGCAARRWRRGAGSAAAADTAVNADDRPLMGTGADGGGGEWGQGWQGLQRAPRRRLRRWRRPRRQRGRRQRRRRQRQRRGVAAPAADSSGRPVHGTARGSGRKADVHRTTKRTH